MPNHIPALGKGRITVLLISRLLLGIILWVNFLSFPVGFTPIYSLLHLLLIPLSMLGFARLINGSFAFSWCQFPALLLTIYSWIHVVTDWSSPWSLFPTCFQILLKSKSPYTPFFQLWIYLMMPWILWKNILVVCLCLIHTLFNGYRLITNDFLFSFSVA